MKRFKAFLISLSGFLSFIFLTPVTTATPLLVLTTEEPPYNYLDPVSRQASGFASDIAIEMLSRADITLINDGINVMPWPRAYKMALHQNNVLIFSLTRTPERENLFKWVGPIAPREYWLWRFQSSDIVSLALSELHKYRIGGVRDYAITRYLQQIPGIKASKIIQVNSTLSLYKMAQAGHIDLFPDTALGAAYQLRFSGIKKSIAPVLMLDNRYFYYFGLSKNTSDDLVNKLQKALNSMKTDGFYQHLFDEYLIDQVNLPESLLN